MIRILITLLVMSSSALAEPALTYKYTGNGSSEACVSKMAEDEHTKLWVQVLHELEFAGYKAQVVENDEAREFTNGLYFLLLIRGTDGFCVVYRDANQPQVPSLYGGQLPLNQK